MKKYCLYLLLALLIIIADQISKTVASNLLTYQIFDWGPFLRFTLVHNYGAAFGFLSDAGGIQYYIFSLVAISVSVVLLIWLWRSCQSELRLAFALCFILAGALGNLVDRLQFGYVVDFINLHYQHWYFPAFNIADMSITIGAVLLIWDSVFTTNKDSRNEGR